MLDTLLPRIDRENADAWLNHHQSMADAEASLRVHFSAAPHATVSLTDLSLAMLPGKACVRYSVEPLDTRRLPHDIVFHYGSAGALFAALQALPWTEGAYGYDAQPLSAGGQHYEVRRSDLESKRVFSPLHLDRLKPLVAAPQRWTVPHALRALANGQYEDLRCTGRYSDDYAFDAAVDFRRGEIQSPLTLVQRIFESPRGWRCYEHNDRVSLNCHHFDYNSFRLRLASEAKAA